MAGNRLHAGCQPFWTQTRLWLQVFETQFFKEILLTRKVSEITFGNFHLSADQQSDPLTSLLRRQSSSAARQTLVKSDLHPQQSCRLLEMRFWPTNCLSKRLQALEIAKSNVYILLMSERRSLSGNNTV